VIVFSHVQFLCGIWSQVLCCPISIVTGTTAETAVQRTFTFLTKRIAAVLRFRTTRVRVPLARNPSPLQYPTLHVQMNSVRSLLRQPRSALEAGPSEAHAIGFVHTPIPRLHREGYTFSVFPPPPKEYWAITHSAEASSIFGADGFGWWVVTHSLAGADFHGHRPTVQIYQHPFHVSRISRKVLTPHIPKRFIPHRLLRLPKKAHLVP